MQRNAKDSIQRGTILLQVLQMGILLPEGIYRSIQEEVEFKIVRIKKEIETW